MKTILRENLISALILAIKSQREYERTTLGYCLDSGLVGGWREIMQALAAGEFVEIGPADEASVDAEAFVRGCLGERLAWEEDTSEAPPAP